MWIVNACILSVPPLSWLLFISQIFRVNHGFVWSYVGLPGIRGCWSRKFYQARYLFWHPASSMYVNAHIVTEARFPSKCNRLRCVRCVWMETGLDCVIDISVVCCELLGLMVVLSTWSKCALYLMYSITLRKSAGCVSSFSCQLRRLCSVHVYCVHFNR